jgi:hypothetical protein
MFTLTRSQRRVLHRVQRPLRGIVGMGRMMDSANRACGDHMKTDLREA